jgi:septal ring factor EnvC (AmiA/AmiB activator)
MTNRDSRDIMFDSRLEKQNEEHQEQLASERRKWEFRYNNQDKRIKELQETIAKLRKKVRELKNA